MNKIERARKLRSRLEYMVTSLEDADALTVVEFFPKWEIGVEYIVDTRIRYNNILYKCVQAHTSQSDWTPDLTPALWATVSIEEFPEWVQPTGSADAYNTGDKVTFEEHHYISLIDANTWSPTAYPAGWEFVE